MEEELKELILNNRNLIYSIIHRLHGKDYEELFQVGCIGLINAYKSFKKEYNTKFTSYAYQFIFGEIYKHILNNRSIRMGIDDMKLLSKLQKVYDYLSVHLGRSPTDTEVADFLEIDLYKLYEIKNMQSIESLDYNYDDNNLYSFISFKKTSQDDLMDLEKALNHLPDTEKNLIKARYFQNMTQKELARRYNTTQVKISRDEQKILCKLKKIMN